MSLVNQAQGEPKKKTTKGRQKINIERIEDNGKRMVTFTKRRNGLFRKAAQMSRLGGEVAVITFSPGGKAHSLGHPSVDGIVSRYLNEPDQENVGTEQQVEKEAKLAKSKSEYEALVKELKELKRQRALLMEQRMNDVKNGTFWWQRLNINQLGKEDLEALIPALEAVKINVSAAKADKFTNNMIN